jgi:hypothetical protein
MVYQDAVQQSTQTRCQGTIGARDTGFCLATPAFGLGEFARCLGQFRTQAPDIGLQRLQGDRIGRLAGARTRL